MDLLEQTVEQLMAARGKIAQMKALLSATLPYIAKEQDVLNNIYKDNEYMLAKYQEHSDLLRRIQEALQ